MQNCRWQCQSRNSGNVGNTDRAGFGWKWETESSHSDPLKVNLTKTWAGISFVKVCASEFVFENTPKWGEGVQSATLLPLPQYFNSKNVSRLRHQLHFLFHFRQTRNTSICVATALMRFEAQAIFHTYCVLNPISGLGELRVGWSLVCKSSIE